MVREGEGKVLPGVGVEVKQETEKVFTWPYLVRIEMIGMLLYLVGFSILSIFINAPLRNLANPEVTPNPAKAPWYFLGLQELLLHMHPALAGVLLPAGVLVGLASMPYFDRSRSGIGVYFSTANGKAIAIFSFIYTAVWEIALILIDEYLNVLGMPEGSHGLGPLLKFLLTPALGSQIAAFLAEVIMPIGFILLIPSLLVAIVKRVWKADMREIMVALYSFFFASFVVLTIVGSAFRGHSMALMWPWEVGHPEEPLQ